MPFRIAKIFEIESGHLLTKHPGRCRFPHGHSRRIEVVLSADKLDERDMVCDFKAVKAALHEFVDRWDHALALNTDDPNFSVLQQTYGERVVAFERTDPTSEAMAHAIFRELQKQLAGGTARSGGEFPVGHGVRVKRVRVSETSSSWAEYGE